MPMLRYLLRSVARSPATVDMCSAPRATRAGGTNAAALASSAAARKTTRFDMLQSLGKNVRSQRLRRCAKIESWRSAALALRRAPRTEAVGVAWCESWAHFGLTKEHGWENTES
eukprot:scaffold48_cov311-Pinguiococcus_pyrenoidosus.AAC.176